MADPALSEDLDVPYCVARDWLRCDVISRDAQEPFRLLWWSDTRVGLERRCDRGPRGVIVCAPELTKVGQPGGHQIVRGMEISGWLSPTVTPSILCPDCGLHGFITAGTWRECLT